MKKIFLIILFSCQIFGQSSLLLLFDNAGYDKDAQAYFDVATTLNKAQKDRINTFVVMLKDSLAITSLSTKFDIIYLLANGDSVSSKLNLVKRSFDAVKIGTVTFTANQGWLGDGATGYLDPKYDYSATTTFSRNSGHISIYNRKASVGAGVRTFIGSTFSTTVIQGILTTGANAWDYYLMNGGTSAVDATPPAIQGFMAIDRSSATTVTAYKNGVQSDQKTSNNSAALSTIGLYILADNYWNGSIFAARRFVDAQVSFFSLGISLDATEHRKLKNCVEWYMDDLGTGVIP